MAIEVAPPPGTKCPPKPSEAQDPRQTRPRPSALRTMHRAIIGVVVTRRAEGQPALVGRGRARSRRPSNGRARNAAPACRASGPGRGSPRGRAGNRRSAAHGPCAACSTCRPDRPCPRQSKATTAKPRCEQFADRLEILLDELGPALEDADRALRRAAVSGSQQAARSVTPSLGRRPPSRADRRGTGLSGVARSCTRADPGSRELRASI